MAVVGGGAQAELAVVHERAATPVPEALDWPAAGGVPEVFTTAHDAMFTQAELQLGSGCSSTAPPAGSARRRSSSAAPRARGRARPCATRPSAATSRRWAPASIAPDGFGELGPFDVVLELIGAPNLGGDLKALATGGRIAVIGVGAGFVGELNLLALMGKRGRIHGSTLRARPLEEKAVAARLVERHVLPLFDRGEPTVPIADTFPLDQVAEAYDRFAAGGKLGKIVILCA